MNRRPMRWAVPLALALVVAACSDGDSGGAGSSGSAERVTVLPDLDAPEFVVNVYATDDGYEQPIVHVPAGRYIKLILRDHGMLEHHYRVVGLVPAQLRWAIFPHLSAEDIPNMSDEQLRDAGLDPDLPIDDLEHVLHHLRITYSSTPPNSRSAIEPLGTEVHAITYRGSQAVVYFFALTTGTYEVVDSAHPEITGQLVVYLPADATIASGS